MKLPIPSYSFYNQLENCPFKAYNIYVARTIPYVESPEMAWGNRVHSAMEHRIKHGDPLPGEMQAAERVAAQFHDYKRVAPVGVELQLAMTQDGKPAEWKAPNVFFRGKLDLVVRDDPPQHAWMIDWKSGNVREDPFELECGALLLKVHYPSLRDIQAEYFWMKTGTAGLRYTLNNHAETYQKLARLKSEAENYFRMGQWPKRKNPLCGWCDVLTCENNTKLKRLEKEGK